MLWAWKQEHAKGAFDIRLYLHLQDASLITERTLSSRDYVCDGLIEGHNADIIMIISLEPLNWHRDICNRPGNEVERSAASDVLGVSQEGREGEKATDNQHSWDLWLLHLGYWAFSPANICILLKLRYVTAKAGACKNSFFKVLRPCHM